MKVIRQAMWTEPTFRPFSMAFMTERDVKDLDETVVALNKPLPGIFTALEVMTLDGDIGQKDRDIVGLVLEGNKQYYASELARVERDQAMLYFYNAIGFTRMNGGGVFSNKTAHPLTAEQIAHVFRQLVVSPLYKKDVTMMGFGTDFRMVTLHDGVVAVASEPMR